MSSIIKAEVAAGWVESGKARHINMKKRCFSGRLACETQHFHQPRRDEALGSLGCSRFQVPWKSGFLHQMVLLFDILLVELTSNNKVDTFSELPSRFSISPKPWSISLEEKPLQNRVRQIIHCPQSLSHQLPRVRH